MIDNLLNSQGEDRILLLSGGPKSHLAKRSMFAKGMKRRLIITQPSTSPKIEHSPLNGETILQSQSVSAKLILSKVKKINDRLYIFLLDHKFESVWPSITSSKNQKQFESQFHKWFDFLKTIKLLKFI